ncbi:MAG: hypothetical protein QGF59_08380, partial [Pirellulaceae bacterium]|nr:hypothetical protein [Pirellulaceae bacterium]
MKVVSWLRSVGLVAAAMMSGSFMGVNELPSTYAADAETGSARTRGGLQALYDFRSADGSVVKDQSGVGDPVHLRIENIKSVRRSKGSL